MYAAAPAYQLVDLVRFETRDVELKIASLFRHRSVLRFVLEIPANWVADWVTSRVEDVAQTFATQALGFKGISGSIEQLGMKGPIDPDQELAAMLEKVIIDIANIRLSTEKFVKLRESRNATRVGLTNALKRVALAANEVHQEACSVKTILLAHDARCGLFASDPVFVRLMESAANMETGIARLTNDDISDLDEELLSHARSVIKAIQNK